MKKYFDSCVELWQCFENCYSLPWNCIKEARNDEDYIVLRIPKSRIIKLYNLVKPIVDQELPLAKRCDDKEGI